MSEQANELPSISEYKAIGLIANPFRRTRTRDGESLGVSLEIQSACNRSLAAIDEIVGQERAGLLWIEKSADFPMYFHNAALITLEKVLINDDDFNVLPAYVQLFVARMGRVRAVLNVVAERFATRSFDQTLEAWVSSVIADPDEELLVDDIIGERWTAFAAAFADSSQEALSALFGTYDILRRPELEQLPDPRAVGLDPEPEDAEESLETDRELEEMPPDVGFVEPQAPDLALEYLIAFARKHVSPVFARGLRAYVQRGAGALADELKITKAPSKTLKMLTTLAGERFRSVVVMYDGFDNWAMVPEDLRVKYVASISELRARLGKGATFVVLANTHEAGELEDQFGGGRRVVWEYPGVRVFEERGNDTIDERVISGWIASATLPGAEPMSLDREPIASSLSSAEGSLERFCKLAADAIDAAARGLQ